MRKDIGNRGGESLAWGRSPLLPARRFRERGAGIDYVIAPLVSHRLGNAREGAAAFMGGLGRAGRVALPFLSPSASIRWQERLVVCHYVSRHEGGQVFEPEAGGLAEWMPIFPRLNCLVRIAPTFVELASRIFDGDVENGRIAKSKNKVRCRIRFQLPLWTPPPPRTSPTQELARRVCHHQIPMLPVGNFDCVPLDMPSRITLCRQQVTGPRIEATRTESIADNRAVFAGDKHPQLFGTITRRIVFRAGEIGGHNSAPNGKQVLTLKGLLSAKVKADCATCLGGKVCRTAARVSLWMAQAKSVSKMDLSNIACEAGASATASATHCITLLPPIGSWAKLSRKPLPSVILLNCDGIRRHSSPQPRSARRLSQGPHQ